MSDKSGVEGLKDKLYSRTGKVGTGDVRSPLEPHTEEVDTSWSPDAPLPEKTPAAPTALTQSVHRRGGFAGKFLFGAVGFFVVAAGVAAYFFFGGAGFISPNNIDLQIVAPSLIDGGSEATVQFIVTNRNSSELRLADLVIYYPEGTRDPKNPTRTLPHERQSIGVIAPGQQIKRTGTAIFYGQEGSAQSVRAVLEYSLPNSNAIFTKENSVAFTLGSSPASVLVDAPQEAIAGQEFEIVVTLRSNATTPLTNLAVEAQYPFGFSVTGVSPEADTGGRLWRLGTLAPGASQVIRVRGVIEGQDGDERVFRFLAGSEAEATASKIKVPFLSVPTTLTVHRPFISGTLVVDGNRGKIIAATPGRPLRGTVLWQNNLAESVSNVEITLKFAGAVLDKGSVESSGGFYQSGNSSIIWTSAQDPSLAQVPPGGSGSLDFSFAALPVGSGGTVYANPTVDLALTVKGTRPGAGSVPEEVSSAAAMQVVFASVVSLEAQALYTAGVQPPRAEQKTSYTLGWTVKNSSNAVANAAVTAVLPPYVDFVSGQSDVVYDSASRTIRWNIGDIQPGAGWSAAAETANFQLTLNASASQVGSQPALTGTAILTGQDRFAQTAVSASANAPTTGQNILPK